PSSSPEPPDRDESVAAPGLGWTNPGSWKRDGDHKIMILYEYVDLGGRGAMTGWVKTKEAREHAGYLVQALSRLEQVASTESLPGRVAGPLALYRHIYKLRMGGKVRLRVLLCKGPCEPAREMTLLMPAFERNWKLEPPDAPARADRRRQEILFDSRRRRPY